MSAGDASRPTVAQVNALDLAAFVALLGDVFEHSAWVAERSWGARPFVDVGALHAAMVAEVGRASEAEQLALIRAHPELGGREAASGALSAASAAEQKGAGLDAGDADALARLRALNAAYRARFRFPFVVAVKGRSRSEIVALLEARVANDHDAEFRRALDEVARIAGLRLDSLFGERCEATHERQGGPSGPP